MTGKHAAWLVSLPVAVAGWLAAHMVAYALAEPDAGARAGRLDASGHGYLEHLPLVALGLLATVVAGAALHALAAARGRRTHACSPWLFALLPPLAFVVQEHLERFVHDGALPLAALEPTFLLGLLLQLPFALLARAAAGLLLHTAAELGRALSMPPPRRPAVAVRSTVALDLCLTRLSQPAAGSSERGPPIPIATGP